MSVVTTSDVTEPATRYYYDTHPTEEDLLADNLLQDWLCDYLKQLLVWLLHGQKCTVVRNVNVYSGRKGPGEEPLAPDVMVLKGYSVPEDPARWPKSWSPSVPGWVPPAIVFEIASEETWERDVDTKPARYAELGALEYVYYDARPLSEIPARRREGYRSFRMWKNVGGIAYEQETDSRSWIWSEELESWLVPDGAALRLYDRLGERRLTEAEAKSAEAEAERQARERAWAKLRELGIDPSAL
jgi:Uma2 family endonuclease